jgi:tRNA pseudouridine32 synthase / 23S rRNA pseudouridine746 synthase
VACDAADALLAWLSQGGLGRQCTAALHAPGGGKMFGVLVVATPEGLRALWAFSGQLQGSWRVEGFVPPALDESRWRQQVPHEDTIAQLTRQSQTLEAQLEQTKRVWGEEEAARQLTREQLFAQHRQNKAERDQRRRAGAAEAELAAWSRRDKAERRKLDVVESPVLREVARLKQRLQLCAQRRATASAALMRRYVECYQLQAFSGASVSLAACFAPTAPPSGAGDCCGPKLLVEAARQSLKPVAMAEVWWGAPQADGGRQPGTFSPACQAKCGPLLPALLSGVDVAPMKRKVEARRAVSPLLVRYRDDDVVVVEKPYGLLSVPGRAADVPSVESLVQQSGSPHARVAHRLDQETSGLVVVALHREALISLQRQFSSRLVQKMYLAVLQGQPKPVTYISLSLRGDPTDRPRQRVDAAGKTAETRVWHLRQDVDGAVVALAPLTGRTHQLRVHCAHTDGLAAPIVGDALYGWPAQRMLLHAHVLQFEHPRTGHMLKLISQTWPSELLLASSTIEKPAAQDQRVVQALNGVLF